MVLQCSSRKCDVNECVEHLNTLLMHLQNKNGNSITTFFFFFLSKVWPFLVEKFSTKLSSVTHLP